MAREATGSRLAEFLRSARARLSPQEAGLEREGLSRRRVPGLRREELARLAGVSVDYYTNQARFVFLDPHAHELYTHWDTVAGDTAAMLRLDAGRHPDDPALSALVGDLSVHSQEFRRYWSDNKVHRRTTGTKDYHQPIVGDVAISYQALNPWRRSRSDPVRLPHPAGQPVGSLTAAAGLLERPHGTGDRAGAGPHLGDVHASGAYAGGPVVRGYRLE